MLFAAQVWHKSTPMCTSTSRKACHITWHLLTSFVMSFLEKLPAHSPRAHLFFPCMQVSKLPVGGIKYTDIARQASHSPSICRIPYACAFSAGMRGCEAWSLCSWWFSVMMQQNIWAHCYQKVFQNFILKWNSQIKVLSK